MESVKIDEMLANPDLARYRTIYTAGQVIFLEGDGSQDLYILVAGQIEIYKGDKKIREIHTVGSVFGEVSFFLGDKRTASVKAKNSVEVIRIPKEEINDFLQDHPDAAKEITKRLARSLDEATRIVHGLKEFCDQLPDAVIITDSSGKMLAWNSTAENLYGKDWHQMSQGHVDEIYEDPQSYRDFIEEVQTQYSVREKIFQINHPQKGRRFISTSTTVLYDGHHNYQGVLSLGRDVTSVKNLEKKYNLPGPDQLTGRFLTWILHALADKAMEIERRVMDKPLSAQLKEGLRMYNSRVEACKENVEDEAGECDRGCRELPSSLQNPRLSAPDAVSRHLWHRNEMGCPRSKL